jgi:enoyl-CoA hydratase/carnithine racemase
MLASRAPLAVQGMKRALNAVARGTADAAEVNAAVFRCMRSEDLAEGLLAWAQKRAPAFRGR